jgi:hypothetical protein
MWMMRSITSHRRNQKSFLALRGEDTIENMVWIKFYTSKTAFWNGGAGI